MKIFYSENKNQLILFNGFSQMVYDGYIYNDGRLATCALDFNWDDFVYVGRL